MSQPYFGGYTGAMVQAGVTSELLSKLQTGNPIADTFMSLMIMGSQDVVQQLLNWLKDLFKGCPKLLYYFIRIVLQVRKRFFPGPNKVLKTCVVKSIGDDKKINDVYPAVSWFINSKIKPEDQPWTTISSSKDNTTPQQQISENEIVEFEFEGYHISAQRSKKMITIYADREYNRENDIITLTATEVPSHVNLFMDLVEHCQTQYDARKSKWEQLIYRNDNGKWVSKPSRTRRKIDTVILKNGQMEEIVNDMDEFLASEEWYVDRDVPYTRRYLFHGTPGTGKSSAIKALACRSKRHIHYLVLSDVKSDSDLFRLLEQIKFEDTIVVIEDIDCASDVTHSRAPVLPPKSVVSPIPDLGPVTQDPEEPAEKLTLSGLLNAIDGGMLDSHGQILISTTNHPEVLDAALIRSGRINQRYSFHNCTSDQIVRLYYNFFDQDEACSYMSEADAGMLSPSDVTEIFLLEKKNPTEAWKKLLEKIEREKIERVKTQ